MLEAGQRGDYAELQWFYRFIERRYPVLRACIMRRRAALTKLQWTVQSPEPPPPGATPAMACAQRQWLHQFYHRVDNLDEALRHLALAEFRGFCLLAKRRGSDGAVRELYWLPQWNVQRDGLEGDYYWNPDGRPGATAQWLGSERRLDPAGLVVREAELPVNEIAAVAFVRSSLALKDWSAFVEVYGLPGAVAITRSLPRPTSWSERWRISSSTGRARWPSRM